MVDYYAILGTDRESSLREIKQSFRKRAKELHPDLNSPIKGGSTSEEMMQLLKAYKTLSNPKWREEYDRIFNQNGKQDDSHFDYRDFLRKQKDDHISQSKLIFYDLINSNTEAAIDLYEEMVCQDSYDLEKCLDRADYLECVFLLAEEFEKKGEYVKAFNFLKHLYYHEMMNPFFKHFIEEIIERMKNVVCFKMTSIFPPELILKHLGELVQFNFSSKDNAFFYKKMAEISIKCGEKEQALNYLKLGLQCNKKLSGIKKLKERIGI